MDLTGIWKCNDGGTYFVRQNGDDLWWVGEHPERKWVNLFKGTITDETLAGEWVDLPKGKARGYGSISLNIESNKMVLSTPGADFEGTEWKKENVISFFSNRFSNQTEFLIAGYGDEDTLTGGWLSDESGFFYLRQIGDTVWWFGEHPKRDWAHVFKGTRSGPTLSGEWIDLPKGKSSEKGELQLEIGQNGRYMRLPEENKDFPCAFWHKFIGNYAPGETGFDPDYHPEVWTIEWNERNGLNFEAYDTVFRPPYIQNVTSDSATVIWRVNVPQGTNPAEAIPNLKAEVLIAPLDVPVANGDKYTLKNGITVSDVSWTYQFTPETVYDQERPVHHKKDLQRLENYSARPIIQFKVTFTKLQPGTVYHYRIKSSAIDPSSGLNEAKTEYLTLVNDTYFKTASAPEQNMPVRFLAMGDLGPSHGRPSYFYDVFDLFHDVARKYSPELWLALGDLESDTGGHPNAIDPFFFNVYNAFHDHNFEKTPRRTSNLSYKAQETNVKAFRRPPYYGLLGGLPVYPTFGADDLAIKKDSSLERWRQSYLGNFELPSEGSFNQAGQGFFYTFRSGNVIFISLGIPQTNCTLGLEGNDWRAEWGNRQQCYLAAYLNSLKTEISDPTLWVVVYFHDYHWGYAMTKAEEKKFSKLLAESGVDLVLMGRQHGFAQKTIKYDQFDYRAIVAGTGGFGGASWHGNENCKRPGFIMANVYEDTFEYWKFDTHKCKNQGQPESRDNLSPTVREYCRMKKLGFGKHEVKELDLNTAYIF